VHARESRHDLVVGASFGPPPRTSEKDERRWNEERKREREREGWKKKRKREKGSSPSADEEEKRANGGTPRERKREHVCVNARGVFFAAASGE